MTFNYRCDRAKRALEVLGERYAHRTRWHHVALLLQPSRAAANS